MLGLTVLRNFFVVVGFLVLLLKLSHFYRFLHWVLKKDPHLLETKMEGNCSYAKAIVNSVDLIYSCSYLLQSLCIWMNNFFLDDLSWNILLPRTFQDFYYEVTSETNILALLTLSLGSWLDSSLVNNFLIIWFRFSLKCSRGRDHDSESLVWP